MTITLSAKTEEIINEKVNSGAYGSPDEVILKALQLLNVEEEKLENLRKKIMIGVQDIQQGKFTVVTTDEEINQFADEIIKQGQIRLTQGSK